MTAISIQVLQDELANCEVGKAALKRRIDRMEAEIEKYRRDIGQIDAEAADIKAALVVLGVPSGPIAKAD